MASRMSDEDLREVVSALCAVAESVCTAFLRPQLRDPADEMGLEARINGNADALVTFNSASIEPRDDTPLSHEQVETATNTAVLRTRRVAIFPAEVSPPDRRKA